MNRMELFTYRKLHNLDLYSVDNVTADVPVLCFTQLFIRLHNSNKLVFKFIIFDLQMSKLRHRAMALFRFCGKQMIR